MRHQRILIAMILFCIYPLNFLAAGGEVPPIVGTFSPPNIVILFDNSLSMKIITYHPGFDYLDVNQYAPPGNYNDFLNNSGHDNPGDPPNRASYGDRIYIYSGNYTINGKPVHLSEGLYMYDYLNWIYGYATQEQLNNIPQVTRIEVAQDAIHRLMDKTTSMPLRYGLAYFYNQYSNIGYPGLGFKDGGFIAVKVDDDNYLNIENAVDQITLGDYDAQSKWMSGGTPLAESLYTIYTYFKGGYNDIKNPFLPGSLPSPIQNECQQNFVIIVTDGFSVADMFTTRPTWLPANGLDIEEDGLKHDPKGWLPDANGVWGWRDYEMTGSDYLDDVALYIATHDVCSTFPGDQVIYTYTVGFYVDYPLLRDTADINHGQGQYFPVTNAEQLADAIESAITDIINRTSSATAAAVLSTSLKTGNMIYSAKFTPLNWTGDLEAYSLPYAEGSGPVWKAGEILEARNPATRTIYTARINYSEQTVNVRETFDATLDDSLTNHQKDVINWVRGEYNPNFRDRGDAGASEWKLGDICYSSPMVVGPPKSPFMDASYAEFKAQWADRDPIIYVGANDGMLHAFDAITGEERWAFIPHNFCYETYIDGSGYYNDMVNLDDLEDLTSRNYGNNHRYYVDGTCVSEDVYIDPGSTGNPEWRTIIIFGLRGGGSGYICLDVTDPDDPRPLWAYSYFQMGESWCLPSVGRIRLNGYSYWVLAIGSGPDPGDDPFYDGKLRFYLIDIESGYPIYSRKVSDLTPNMTMGISNIDANNDGFMDFLYTGDKNGNIWKYDTTTSVIFSDNLFKARSTSNDVQPIMVMPTLFLDRYNRIMVQFGTGQFFEPLDRLDATPQSFYGLMDDNSGTPSGPWTRNDLADQTDVGHIQDLEGKRGFVFDLPHERERVITESVYFDKITFFTSYVPSTDVCDVGGDSYLYFIDYYTGAPFKHAIVDVNRDNTVDENDYIEGTRSILLGGDAGAPSKPIISPATNEVIIQTSDTRIRTRLFDFDAFELISWRETLQ